MTEYIEREAFKAEIRRLSTHYLNEWDTLGVLAAADRIPAADVRPVVRAYWKSVPHKRARVCSRCEADEPYKFADDDANVYNFCPKCGAMMEEQLEL